eukprot:scaffold564_cov248-Pinguiococcus_pyrenoidosus.AAC.14
MPNSHTCGHPNRPPSPLFCLFASLDILGQDPLPGRARASVPSLELLQGREGSAARAPPLSCKRRGPLDHQERGERRRAGRADAMQRQAALQVPDAKLPVASRRHELRLDLRKSKAFDTFLMPPQDPLIKRESRLVHRLQPLLRRRRGSGVLRVAQDIPRVGAHIDPLASRVHADGQQRRLPVAPQRAAAPRQRQIGHRLHVLRPAAQRGAHLAGGQLRLLLSAQVGDGPRGDHCVRAAAEEVMAAGGHLEHRHALEVPVPAAQQHAGLQLPDVQSAVGDAAAEDVPRVRRGGQRRENVAKMALPQRRLRRPGQLHHAALSGEAAVQPRRPLAQERQRGHGAAGPTAVQHAAGLQKQWRRGGGGRLCSDSAPRGTDGTARRGRPDGFREPGKSALALAGRCWSWARPSARAFHQEKSRTYVKQGFERAFGKASSRPSARCSEDQRGGGRQRCEPAQVAELGKTVDAALSDLEPFGLLPTCGRLPAAFLLALVSSRASLGVALKKPRKQEKRNKNNKTEG